MRKKKIKGGRFLQIKWLECYNLQAKGGTRATPKQTCMDVTGPWAARIKIRDSRQIQIGRDVIKRLPGLRQRLSDARIGHLGELPRLRTLSCGRHRERVATPAFPGRCHEAAGARDRPAARRLLSVRAAIVRYFSFLCVDSAVAACTHGVGLQ